MKKSIEKIINPPQPHFVGDGFRVHNFIPSVYPMQMKRMDPFIMFDYNSKHFFPPTDKPRGVGVHPHRGFETVTIAFKGKISHHDSSGGGGTIGQGDVQWMTAGSGILHKEYHEKTFSQKGGDFQMVQLWINLPSSQKMTVPKYQSIKHDDIPIYKLNKNQGKIKVIAGQYKDLKGIAETFSPIHLLNVELKSNAEIDFNLPENYNTALLVIDGEIKIENQLISTNHLVLFENNGELFDVEASTDCKILILSGKPLNEPIAAQGPFVMNTKREIEEAIRDFTEGKFGHLND